MWCWCWCCLLQLPVQYLYGIWQLYPQSLCQELGMVTGYHQTVVSWSWVMWVWVRVWDFVPLPTLQPVTAGMGAYLLAWIIWITNSCGVWCVACVQVQVHVTCVMCHALCLYSNSTSNLNVWMLAMPATLLYCCQHTTITASSAKCSITHIAQSQLSTPQVSVPPSSGT